MRPALGRRQAVLLVVAGVVVVSGLAAVASPARDRQDAPRQSLTDGTPPTTQVGPAATTVTPLTPEVAWRMGGANATNTRNPANTGYLNTTGPTSPLTIRWTFETDYTSGLQVANGTVYLGAPSTPSTDNDQISVYAFDAWTGEKRWQFRLSSIINLVVFRDTVYVSERGGRVYALDAATGEQFWTARTGGRFPSLTVANRTLYVTSDELYALDALTGDERWLFDTNDKTDHTAVKDGSVYISVDNGPLHAVDAQTGTKRWTFDNKTRKSWEFGSPAVANGLVYVSDSSERGGADTKLYALDADTGEQQWAFDPVGDVGAPAVVNDTLYVGVRGNGLYALDAISGSERWHVRQFTRTPMVVANAAYVPSRGSMYSLHPANGSERGRFTPPPFNNSRDRFGVRSVLNGSLYIEAELDNPAKGGRDDSTVFYAVGTPEFEYTDLSVTPQSPGVNESVRVTATVRNTGMGPGEFNATLGVDGTIINTTTDTLDPRTSRTVTFTHTFQENGTYTVRIAGLSRRIGVGDVELAPTPTATATEATGQTGTQQSEPTPTPPAPTATPTSSTVPGFGVGVAVAAVVVTGLLTRRRWT